MLPPEDWALTGGEVHVFAARLDPPPPQVRQCSALLSEDERARAGRFHFEDDRRRFLVGRGLLRRLLGWATRAEPRRLVFSYSVTGKPRLVAEDADRFVHFNLAHANELVVYALSRVDEVGIDVEFIRALPDADAVAGQFFSPQEYARWCALPAALSTEAFFNCWTRKEAFLKASGAGISEALSQVEVSFVPGEPPRYLRLAGDASAAARWRLEPLAPAPGYVGALATKQTGTRVACWKWPVGESTI